MVSRGGPAFNAMGVYPLDCDMLLRMRVAWSRCLLIRCPCPRVGELGNTPILVAVYSYLHRLSMLAYLLQASFRSHYSAVFAVALVCSCLVGCGTTREHQATEQLVLSMAVDRSIAGIDFRALSGRRVYLDTSYMRQVKDVGFVNAEYVTSSLRQQIAAAGCLLQDTSQDADVIIEARIGTLGSDDHRVTLGIPENNGISTAANFIPNTPQLPAIPEIAIARRDAREGASKVAAFAYDRETRKVVWQSGIRESTATARDTYVMGIGPFQTGSIREQKKLAGSKFFKFGRVMPKRDSPPAEYPRPPVNLSAETRFHEGWPVLDTHDDAFINFLEAPHDPAVEIANPAPVAGDPIVHETDVITQ